ncbi:hypothetical protein L596_006988 [Steinernema carpocapsae]|uniref:Uncharacterized protein n=1 Tax=Steinernema carpocapsae TaxID=34508 RepID=A0A4U5P7Q6_STECR|nr:hypothetical protein L596_006988 [Steinernema carpocapsae]
MKYPWGKVFKCEDEWKGRNDVWKRFVELGEDLGKELKKAKEVGGKDEKRLKLKIGKGMLPAIPETAEFVLRPVSSKLQRGSVVIFSQKCYDHKNSANSLVFGVARRRFA